jgi:ribosome-associated heat shock protein Hsp15
MIRGMSPADPCRLDVWLDVACLCRTRSEAQKACKAGKVDVNGQSAKAQRPLKVGDVVEISRPRGVRQRVIVRQLETQHVAKAMARTFYEDTTPEPSPQEKAMLELVRLAGPRRATGPQAAPDRREKRRLRRAKEDWDGPDW